jgi:hypothetical protein
VYSITPLSVRNDVCQVLTFVALDDVPDEMRGLALLSPWCDWDGQPVSPIDALERIEATLLFGGTGR